MRYYINIFFYILSILTSITSKPYTLKPVIIINIYIINVVIIFVRNNHDNTINIDKNY